jgi:hypothetical protein
MICIDYGPTLAFSATVRFSIPHAAGVLRYRWARSDGAGATTHTVNIPADRASYTVSDSWTVGPPGVETTLWERLAVTLPTSMLSNKATVTFANTYCLAN